MFKKIFASNALLSEQELIEVRGFLKRWGWLIGSALFVVALIIAMQNPSPESGKAFDVVQKLSFGIIRLVLGALGFLAGGYEGYILFQIIESSRAGAETTLPSVNDDPHSAAMKVLNRGLLLVCCVISGAITIGLNLGK